MEGFFIFHVSLGGGLFFKWGGFIFKWGEGAPLRALVLVGGGGIKKNCKMGEGCPPHYGKTLGLEKVNMIIIIINPVVIKLWSKSIFRQGMLTV